MSRATWMQALRRRAAGLALLTFLGTAGCSHQPEIPPYLERQYMGIAFESQFANVEFENDEGSGPFLGGEYMFGAPIKLDGTTETSLEGAWARYTLGTGADFDGNMKRARVGVRRTFNMDQRLRPGWTLGATYQWFNFSGGVADDDFRGPGVYAGGALDYMVAPRLSLGTELRWHLHFWNAHKNNEFATTVDVALRLIYRF